MNPRLKKLTRADIKKTAKGLQPDAVRKWSVKVAGKCFPVKQLVREAANQLPMPGVPLITTADTDFITSDAVKNLRDNRFNPVKR